MQREQRAKGGLPLLSVESHSLSATGNVLGLVDSHDGVSLAVDGNQALVPCITSVLVRDGTVGGISPCPKVKVVKEVVSLLLDQLASAYRKDQLTHASSRDQEVEEPPPPAEGEAEGEAVAEAETDAETEAEAVGVPLAQAPPPITEVVLVPGTRQREPSALFFLTTRLAFGCLSSGAGPRASMRISPLRALRSTCPWPRLGFRGTCAARAGVTRRGRSRFE